MDMSHVSSLGGHPTGQNGVGKTDAADASDASANQESLVAPRADAASSAKRDATEHHISMAFPQRLMEILDDDANADSIAWLPHGKGFMIYKKAKFAEDILDKYFKKAKFTSFTRKLNRWGFSRVSRGQEAGAYYHKFFQRGNARLCMQMTCQGNSKVAQVVPNSMMGLRLDPNQLSQLLQLQQLQIQQLQQKQNMFNTMLPVSALQMTTPALGTLAPGLLTKPTVPNMVAPVNLLAANAHLLAAPPTMTTPSLRRSEGTMAASPPTGVKRASAA